MRANAALARPINFTENSPFFHLLTEGFSINYFYSINRVIKISSLKRFLLCLFSAYVYSHGQTESLFKNNLVQFFTAYNGDTLQSPMPEALAALHSNASSYLSSQNENGSWPDLTYSNAAIGSGVVYNHYIRLFAMAQAWSTRGQPHYHSSDLLSQIEKGLEWANQYYHTGISVLSVALGLYGNWWWWYIGIPSQLGPTLLLLEGRINSDVYGDALNALAHFTAPNGQFPPPIVTGQNVIDIAMAHLYHALITGNTSRLGQIKSTMEDVCGLTESEGIQPDYSFQQHGATLSTGSYGAEFASDISLYMLTSRETDYQLNSASAETFLNYMAESYAWGIHHNYWDPSLIGRSITRQYHSAYLGATSLITLSQLPSSHQTEINAYTKKILESWPVNTLPVEFAAGVGVVNDFPYPAKAPLGFKHFNHSDYSVMRQPGFYASLKMHSSRTRATDEYLNGEGKKSWHLSDGFTYFSLTGYEYYINDIWAVFDWERVPGTTVERKARAANTGYGPGTLNFAGGVSDSIHGVSAMDYAPNTSELTAKKSWYFLDNIVVCLGSGITSASGNSIETIINQRPMDNQNANPVIDNADYPLEPGSTAELENISSLQLENMGYYFPTGTNARFVKQIQSGAWSDIGAGSGGLYSYPMYQLYIDHGVNPEGAAYAYAVLPGASAFDVEFYAGSPSFEILSQSDSLHAVHYPSLSKTGAVFWQAGELGSLEVSIPCGVLWEQSDSSLSLFLSAFSHNLQNVSLSFKGKLYDTQLPPSGSSQYSEGKTLISFSVEKGDSYLMKGKINRPPIAINIPDSILMNENTDTTLLISSLFSDLDAGDKLTFEYSSSAVSLIPEEGPVLRIAPEAGWNGRDTLYITARDKWDDSLVAGIPLIVVYSSNQPPVLDSVVFSGKKLIEGDSLTLKAMASDADGDPLSYLWLSEKGDSLGYGDSLRLFFDYNASGTKYFKVYVYDSLAQVDSLEFNFTVENKAFYPAVLNKTDSFFSDSTRLLFGWETGPDPDLDSASLRTRLNVYCYPDIKETCLVSDSLSGGDWTPPDFLEFAAVAGDSFNVAIVYWDTLGYISPVSSPVTLKIKQSEITSAFSGKEKFKSQAIYNKSGHSLKIYLSPAETTPGIKPLKKSNSPGLIKFELRNLRGNTISGWTEPRALAGMYSKELGKPLPPGIYRLVVTESHSLKQLWLPIF